MIENDILDQRFKMDARLAQFLMIFSRFEFAMTHVELLSGRMGRRQVLVSHDANPPQVSDWQSATADWSKLVSKLPSDVLSAVMNGEKTKVLWQNPVNVFGSAKEQVADWGKAVPAMFLLIDGMPTGRELDPIKWVRNTVTHGESPGLHGRALELVNAGFFALRDVLAWCEANPNVDPSIQAFVAQVNLHEQATSSA